MLRFTRLVSLWLGWCASCAELTPASMPESTGESMPESVSTLAPAQPIAEVCPRPFGSAEEIASTPREYPGFELLALHLDQDAVAATTATYDRLVADILAIHASDPSLAPIGYFARRSATELVLTPDTQTAERIKTGKYSAWDCLNDFYGLKSMRVLEYKHPISTFVILTLKGNYNMSLVAGAYRMLPGIVQAEPEGFGGDTSTICAQRSGTNFEYVLHYATGDCQAGCSIHDAHHFVSTSAGSIETRETWDSTTDERVPEWFARLCKR